MATLAQQRAAIRAGVSNSRAATGADERRATGKRIEDERRGTSVVDDLNRLVAPPQQRRTLRTVPPVGAVPATRGRGPYVPPPATGGGGIASPLVEASYAEREWYAEKTITSSDGLLSFRMRGIKQLRMLDANDAEVLMQFAEPSA